MQCVFSWFSSNYTERMNVKITHSSQFSLPKKYKKITTKNSKNEIKQQINLHYFCCVY